MSRFRHTRPLDTLQYMMMIAAELNADRVFEVYRWEWAKLDVLLLVMC